MAGMKFLFDHRVAGPKPWGGGTVVKSWTANRRDMAAALKKHKGEGK
jgi:hypothetical protein